MNPEKIKFEDLIFMTDHREVMEEVKKIVFLMFPELDFTPINQIYRDIIKLFRGTYPGYRVCNTYYHDLNHTMDCVLCMARLMHGAFIQGIGLEARNVVLALVASLVHDTGYIQTVEETEGSGAQYTLTHIDRSIDFMQKYFEEHGFLHEEFIFCRNCLKCTGLNVSIDEIGFISRDNEIIGKMLGIADLIGQMADRCYVEKLPFLYKEFREGGISGYKDEFDLLQKTLGFWEFTQERLVTELGNWGQYLRDHFRIRWDLDRDLALEAIENNIAYIKFLVENHPKDYRRFLRRGGIMKILAAIEKE